MEAIGLAGVAGQARGRGPHHDVDLLHLPRQIVDRERDRGRRQLGDHVDAFDLVPAPRDGGGEVGLVLVVGGDHLDLLAEHAAAEILHRHLGGLERPCAAVIGVDAGLVDLDALRRGRPGKQQPAGRDGRRQQSRFHVCLPLLLFACMIFNNPGPAQSFRQAK